ncbi:MAG: hypothetical protein V3T30_08465 [Thermodesulfobacteriota bacterium]
MAMAKYVCPSCSHRGKPMLLRKGSRKTEIILWICGIVPGILYSIWRYNTALPACPQCDQGVMISVKSRHGQRLTGA